MTTIDDVRDHLAEDSARNRWIGIWIGILAVLLAFGGWGGGNAALDAQVYNVNAANYWAWYQSKNIRQTDLSIAADQAAVALMTKLQLSPEVRAALEKQTASWSELAAQYKQDTASNGMEELAMLAREAERKRDVALVKDTMFGGAMVALQIAVVLASVAIVLGATLPLWGSGFAGALGTGLMLQGFVG